MVSTTARRLFKFILSFVIVICVVILCIKKVGIPNQGFSLWTCNEQNFYAYVRVLEVMKPTILDICRIYIRASLNIIFYLFLWRGHVVSIFLSPHFPVIRFWHARWDIFLPSSLKFQHSTQHMNSHDMYIPNTSNCRED